jgi:hypothetical protein
MSGPPAEEVKIRLKHGEWEVEVVCIESRVKQVVESVLSSLDTTKMMGPEVQSQLDALRREIDSLKRGILIVKGLLVKYMKSYQEEATTTTGLQSRIRLQIWCEKTS